MKHEFKGERIIVTFDDEVCINSGNCVRAAPGAFDYERDPWINPDDDDNDKIIAAVRFCPSGALGYELT